MSDLTSGPGNTHFDDVVKLTYFVTDVAHLPAVRQARDRVIPADRLPASSAAQVAALFHPELLLEVEAFAVLPVPSAGA